MKLLTYSDQSSFSLYHWCLLVWLLIFSYLISVFGGGYSAVCSWNQSKKFIWWLIKIYFGCWIKDLFGWLIDLDWFVGKFGYTYMSLQKKKRKKISKVWKVGVNIGILIIMFISVLNIVAVSCMSRTCLQLDQLS